MLLLYYLYPRAHLCAQNQLLRRLVQFYITWNLLSIGKLGDNILKDHTSRKYKIRLICFGKWRVALFVLEEGVAKISMPVVFPLSIEHTSTIFELLLVVIFIVLSLSMCNSWDTHSCLVCLLALVRHHSTRSRTLSPSMVAYWQVMLIASSFL